MAVKCVFEVCTKMELTKWREKHVIDQNKKLTSKKGIFDLIDRSDSQESFDAGISFGNFHLMTSQVRKYRLEIQLAKFDYWRNSLTLLYDKDI